MSSPKMSSTDLPSDIDPLRAVKAFTVRHDSLKISLRSNLPNIASKLHNNSVIDEDDLAEAMIPYIIASNRTLKLLSTVKDRIRAEPHMFTEFVKILEAEPTLRFQARKLVEKYLEGSTNPPPVNPSERDNTVAITEVPVPAATPVASSNSHQVTIGVAPSPDYVPNRVQPDGGGKAKQYPVFDRKTHGAELKLHDDDDKTTVIPPQPYNKTPSLRKYYSMKALKHGIVLIINNRNFTSHKERKGTERDEYNLIQTFYFLGYRPIVCNNLTSGEMKYIFDDLDSFLAKSDANAATKVENDSFMCCILSHGTTDSIIGSDSKPISRDYIEQQAGKSKTLSGKPKIFFLQACRGKELGSEPVPTRRTEADDDSSRADIYVCSATVSGDQSYRDIFRGSWFITELCKILCEFSTCYNLDDIQKDLNEKVPKNPANRFEADDGKLYVQQPSCHHTLYHDVHFFFE